jgi:hypothetical protein
MGTFKSLCADEVTFTITAEVDELPVRSNAMASGDDAADKETEDEILARLDRGDVWAWACVTVTACWRNWTGSTSLGTCSYANERDFKRDAYYDDMRADALDELNVRVRDAFEITGG